jgi:hypothetical protein
LRSIDYVDLQNENFRNLDAEELQRLNFLNVALKKLDGKSAVPSQDLKLALTAQQYEDYVKSFDVYFSHVELDDFGEVPAELVQYLETVKRGDRFVRIANLFKRSKKRDGNGHTAHKRYMLKAEHSYEAAVNFLINTIDLNTSRNPNANGKLTAEILRWLDRNVSAEPGAEPEISQIGVPRLRGSKNKYTQMTSAPVLGMRLSKYLRQREALTSATLDLLYDEVDENTDDAKLAAPTKLEKLLAKKFE